MKSDRKDDGIEKKFRDKTLKEKAEDILFYSIIAIAIVVVWNYSYNFGLEHFAKSDLAIGQEYHIKDVYIGQNSTYLIIYHDNDANMTEKTMIPTNYVNVNFTTSNSSMMRLEKVDGDVQYWNVYFEHYKNMTKKI